MVKTLSRRGEGRVLDLIETVRLYMVLEVLLLTEHTLVKIFGYSDGLRGSGITIM